MRFVLHRKARFSSLYTGVATLTRRADNHACGMMRSAVLVAITV